MEKLMEILQSIRPHVDYAGETELIDKRILDSFDMITLIQELEEAFEVEIDLEYVEPENFNSVAAMLELLEKLGAAV
jgi:acyl carrier protein